MPYKRNEKLLIGYTDQELNANYKKIKKFRPLKAQSILKAAEDRVGKDGDHLDRAIIEIIREQTREQLRDVLRFLGVNSADPDAWQKAFLQLTCRIFGVQRLALPRPRPSRNAQSWGWETDCLLLAEVMKRLARGLTEGAAIREICKDKMVIGKLPYRPKLHAEGKKNDRERALIARLRKVKASAKPGFGLLFGDEGAESKNPLARSLRQLSAPKLNLPPLAKSNVPESGDVRN